MKLILLALGWLAVLVVLLIAVVYGLHRAKRIELGSRFTLSDIANFVSVLLAIFALAFTLAAQYQPEPNVEAAFQQTLNEKASSTRLREGEASDFQISRGGGRLFLLLRNTGDAPLRRPTYIVTATPATVQIRCAEEFPQFRPRTDPNVCQFNNPLDIFPDSQAKIPHAFGFELIAPTDVAEAQVQLMLQSENLSLTTYVVKLRIGP
jgi:hypothetical protein